MEAQASMGLVTSLIDPELHPSQFKSNGIIFFGKNNYTWYRNIVVVTGIPGACLEKFTIGIWR